MLSIYRGPHRLTGQFAPQTVLVKEVRPNGTTRLPDPAPAGSLLPVNLEEIAKHYEEAQDGRSYLASLDP